MPRKPVLSRRSLLLGVAGPAALSEAAAPSGASALTTPEDIRSRWVHRENQLPGTSAWSLPAAATASDTALAGYASVASALRGEPVGLHVQSLLGSYTVSAYRIGWYQGYGGRLVWHSGPIAPVAQPRPTLGAGRVVRAGWRRTVTLQTADWPEGEYLIMLRAGGKGKYIPLTLRSSSAYQRLLLVSATTTYQAYNKWGGYSLYAGPDGSFASRAAKVSFERPYDFSGAQKMLAFDVQVVRRAERLSLAVAYGASADLERPGFLTDARGIVVQGHDEYWTNAMRSAVTAARDRGTNVAFFGANNVYWRVRFEDGGRTVVCYKSASLDPLKGSAATTAMWRQSPAPRPEHSLVGMLYECFPSSGALRVLDPSFWAFAGTGVVGGSSFTGLAGHEVDRAYPISGTPANLQVAAHSVVSCSTKAPTHSDLTYYTTASGAGVVSTGTMRWVWGVGGTGSRLGIDSRGTAFARTVTDNILREMSLGPLGRRHPARANLASLGASGSTSTGTGGPIG